jgi:hypothetical protein
MRQLRYDQLAEIRRVLQRWHQTIPPCEISLVHPYNPCLPEPDEDGRLLCLTCGLRQRLALEAAK